MKKITLFISMMAISVAAFSQSCPTVTSAFFSSGISGISLNFSYTANGNKNIILTVKCSGTPILDTCINVKGNGSTVISGLSCAGGINALSATFTGRTGVCTSPVCSNFQVLPPGGGPLPVKLSAFFAKRNNNTVALNWKTEIEINAKEFILESKTGNNFVPVATIAASNKATGSSYSFADNNTNKGITLYRLKVVDIDGSFAYSNISAVKGTATVSNFTVFPNPSSGNAKVTISDISEATDVQLVDLSGRVLKNITITNSNSVELNSLQKGMYMIRIVNKNSGESVTQKLSVVN